MTVLEFYIGKIYEINKDISKYNKIVLNPTRPLVYLFSSTRPFTTNFNAKPSMNIITYFETSIISSINPYKYANIIVFVYTTEP